MHLISRLLRKVDCLTSLKGDSVMADKGFLIQDLLDPLGVTLNMPPKRDSNRQLSRQEVEETRRIAAVRIYVKWKMEQIKNFRIL